MAEVQLNLVVMRSINLEKSVAFYEMLGLDFVKHRHGEGPEHFSAQLGAVTFEIYPQGDRVNSTIGTRLGFQFEDVDAIVSACKQAGVEIVVWPSMSGWGRRAVVVDPDGHRVELIQPPEIDQIHKNLRSVCKKIFIFLFAITTVMFLYASVRAYFVREKFCLLKSGMTKPEVMSVVGDAFISVGYGRQGIDPEAWEVWYLYKQPATPTEYVCIFDANQRLIVAEKGDPWISDMKYEKLIEERDKAVYD